VCNIRTLDHLIISVQIDLMETQVFKTSSQVGISLKGRLDGTCTEQLAGEVSKLLDSETRELQFNCADLDYVSSAGIALFVRLGKEMAARGGAISFSAVTGEVKKVFDLSGLSTIFKVVEGLADASAGKVRKALTKAEGAEGLFLPSKLDSLGVFQDFIRSYARRSDVDPQVFPTIELVVEEIIVNIVRHAYKEGPGDITVECNQDDSRLYLEFQDSGPPFNPLLSEAPDLEVEIKDRKIGGLGIHLVRKMSTDVSYERSNGRNIFRVTVAKKV